MNFKMEPRPRISANAFVLEQEEDFPAEALQQFTALLDPTANYITTQVEANNSVALCFINANVFSTTTYTQDAAILEVFRIRLVNVLNDMELETPDQMYDFAGIKTYLFRPGDSAKQRLFKWAMKVAQAYLDKANPGKWDGKHEKPANVDSRICAFPMNDETVLVLSFDFNKEENMWYALCELKNKESGNVFAQTTSSTNGCADLAKTICHLVTLCDIAMDTTMLEIEQNMEGTR